VNCPYISNEENAKWNETLANGDMVYGECLNGYNGKVLRKCVQSGSNADWSSISGFCYGIPSFFLSFFPFFVNP